MIEARAAAAPMPLSRASSATLPWPLWVAVAAVTSSVLGAQWDIAWHRSIGRDTFWSPPHLAIYLGAVLAGLSCGYLILSATFGRASDGAAVRVWGFRGPLGAFIAAWGGIAMLTSAPFDDWWHGAYGLDVKIISPPHTLLALGMFAILFGALILLLGRQNRSTGAEQRRLSSLLLFTGGILTVMVLTFLMEHTSRGRMHSATFYRDLALALPLFLVGIPRAAGHRWGATVIAGWYSAVLLGLLYVFPLVPAVPKMGPVYVQVTHLIPAGFPLLIIVPALAIDWVRLRGWPAWREAFAAGGLFVGLMLAAQWPFAIFLQSTAARNYVFGTHYFDYNTRPTFHDYRYVFSITHKSAGEFWLQIGVAVIVAVVAARLGISWGEWMRRVKR